MAPPTGSASASSTSAAAKQHSRSSAAAGHRSSSSSNQRNAKEHHQQQQAGGPPLHHFNPSQGQARFAPTAGPSSAYYQHQHHQHPMPPMPPQPPIASTSTAPPPGSSTTPHESKKDKKRKEVVDRIYRVHWDTFDERDAMYQEQYQGLTETYATLLNNPLQHRPYLLALSQLALQRDHELRQSALFYLHQIESVKTSHEHDRSKIEDEARLQKKHVRETLLGAVEERRKRLREERESANEFAIESTLETSMRSGSTRKLRKKGAAGGGGRGGNDGGDDGDLEAGGSGSGAGTSGTSAPSSSSRRAAAAAAGSGAGGSGSGSNGGGASSNGGAGGSGGAAVGGSNSKGGAGGNAAGAGGADAADSESDLPNLGFGFGLGAASTLFSGPQGPALADIAMSLASANTFNNTYASTNANATTPAPQNQIVMPSNSSTSTTVIANPVARTTSTVTVDQADAATVVEALTKTAEVNTASKDAANASSGPDSASPPPNKKQKVEAEEANGEASAAVAVAHAAGAAAAAAAADAMNAEQQSKEATSTATTSAIPTGSDGSTAAPTASDVAPNGITVKTEQVEDEASGNATTTATGALQAQPTKDTVDAAAVVGAAVTSALLTGSANPADAASLAAAKTVAGTHLPVASSSSSTAPTQIHIPPGFQLNLGGLGGLGLIPSSSAKYLKYEVGKSLHGLSGAKDFEVEADLFSIRKTGAKRRRR
ncbi:hypothetical protein OC846_005505 [Tilletia horrida]|uniref:Uncharacterized protein n=1 Tax=Tilletia horrida TaxID=155126 RepID=A0AAN6GLN0_9BASI|nr:hypothetical protein OC846_005505 [Tilletia horrida]KAK0560829.1 hypothetical protein OC861_006110 [Tilletia horrida]